MIGHDNRLAALENGQRSSIADMLLFRALRDRLGFTRLRSAATGGAARPDTFKFFQARGVPLRTLYGPDRNCSGPTRCIRAARSIPIPRAFRWPTDIEIRIESRQPGRRRNRGPPSQHVPRYYKNAEASAADIRTAGCIRAMRLLQRGQASSSSSTASKDLAETFARRALLAAIYREQAEILRPTREAVVLGAGRDALAAMICIRYSIISKWAEKSRIAFTPIPTSPRAPKVYEVLRKESRRQRHAAAGPAHARASCCLQESSTPTRELTRTQRSAAA